MESFQFDDIFRKASINETPLDLEESNNSESNIKSSKFPPTKPFIKLANSTPREYEDEYNNLRKRNYQVQDFGAEETNNSGISSPETPVASNTLSYQQQLDKSHSILTKEMKPIDKLHEFKLTTDKSSVTKDEHQDINPLLNFLNQGFGEAFNTPSIEDHKGSLNFQKFFKERKKTHDDNDINYNEVEQVKKGLRRPTEDDNDGKGNYLQELYNEGENDDEDQYSDNDPITSTIYNKTLTNNEKNAKLKQLIEEQSKFYA